VLQRRLHPYGGGRARGAAEEVRPGTYVFGDRQQMHLSGLSVDDVALIVAGARRLGAAPGEAVLVASGASRIRPWPASQAGRSLDSGLGAGVEHRLAGARHRDDAPATMRATSSTERPDRCICCRFAEDVRARPHLRQRHREPGRRRRGGAAAEHRRALEDTGSGQGFAAAPGRRARPAPRPRAADGAL